MKSTDDNGYVRRVFRQAMPDDLPAVVAERMQTQLAGLRQRFDAEPAISGTPPRRRRLRKWLAAWMTATAAVSPILTARDFVLF